MKWTKNKPKDPGWYWWRYGIWSGKAPVRVTIIQGELWVDGDGAGTGLLTEWRGQWAGPIPEPK